MAKRPCPACRIGLVERALRDVYGRSLVLDECPSCAGVWFDHGELLRVDGRFAENKTGASPGSGVDLAAAVDVSCPACGVSLVRLRDPTLPPELCAWRCAQCQGMWLSPESLRAFYLFRKERLARLRQSERCERENRERRELAGLEARKELAQDVAAPLVSELAMAALSTALPPWAAVLMHVVGALASTFGKFDSNP